MAIGLAAGLDRCGVAGAASFPDVRVELERRREAGMHGGMQFTYRNPERSTDPARTVPDARTLVVGALGYLRPDAPTQPGPRGRVARYAWSDHYVPLREALEQVADHLRSVGATARVLADDNALVDRAAAHRAGLGWYGKNANLLLPGLGSWYVLGSVVTDAEIDAPTREIGDGCGPCTRCIPACPTNAIVAPHVVDARRCLAWLVQAPGSLPRWARDALGDRIYGCDDCQDVCPPNRQAQPTGGDLGRPVDDLERDVDLVEMLTMDDAALIERYGRWYIPRRDPRFLRRNALVVLGNIGRAEDPHVRATVAHYLADEDPMLREHAAWAAATLGCDDLVAVAEADPEPEVRASAVRAGAAGP